MKKELEKLESLSEGKEMKICFECNNYLGGGTCAVGGFCGGRKFIRKQHTCNDGMRDNCKKKDEKLLLLRERNKELEKALKESALQNAKAVSDGITIESQLEALIVRYAVESTKIGIDILSRNGVVTNLDEFPCFQELPENLKERIKIKRKEKYGIE